MLPENGEEKYRRYFPSALQLVKAGYSENSISAYRLWRRRQPESWRPWNTKRNIAENKYSAMQPERKLACAAKGEEAVLKLRNWREELQCSSWRNWKAIQAEEKLISLENEEKRRKPISGYTTIFWRGTILSEMKEVWYRTHCQRREEEEKWGVTKKIRRKAAARKRMLFYWLNEKQWRIERPVIEKIG